MELRTAARPVSAAPVEQEQVTEFIRVARVKEITGVSKSTLMRWIAAKRFPEPVVRDAGILLWDLGECLRWRAEQFKKRAERTGKA